MATIRAYSDLQQSKKLAEILPLESADMHYQYDFDFDELESIPTITEEDDHFVLFPKDVRCWSLAALLTFLPKSAQLEKGNATELYRVTLPVELEASDWYIDPIDACYEVIIKLYELKML